MPTRRRRIPDTRLPFVNAEIAEVAFQGAPHLVSSVWGSSAGGRLYFWNPDTRTQGMRRLPDDIPGAYMLRTAPDGRLYIGCGNGDLVRYDPARDDFETLVTGELEGITWGGVVTDRFACWNASRHGKSGAVAVYDHRAGRLVKVFAPLDTEHPTAHYGHRAVEAPDGRIVWGMNVPQARLIVIEPGTLTARVHTPDWLVGSGWVRPMFLDEKTLAVFHGAAYVREAMVILNWPDLQVRDRPALPISPGSQHTYPVCVAGGLWRLDIANGDLWRMDLASGAWERVAERWTHAAPGILGVWRGRHVCALTVDGRTRRYDPDTGRSDGFELDASGPLEAHALCVVPDRRLIVGAPFINQRFWTLDMDTGEGRDQGRAARGGGQINQMVWDPLTQRALLSSYVTASITAYDPAQPSAWPDNPKELAAAEPEGQMRPMALVHDGRHVWMATSPKYGTLGGALCRLDPTTRHMDVWRHIVPDQKLTALALDPARRRVCFSTDVRADCDSAPPTQSTAVVCAFDMDALGVTARWAPGEGRPHARVLAVLPDGRVLAQREEELLAWDPGSGRVEPFGRAAEELLALLFAPGGMLIAATPRGLGVLEPRGATCEYVPRIEARGARHAEVHGDRLHYPDGFEIVERPLGELAT